MDYVHIAFASPVCVRMSCKGQDSLAISIKATSSWLESNPANHFRSRPSWKKRCSKRGSQPARRELREAQGLHPLGKVPLVKG